MDRSYGKIPGLTGSAMGFKCEICPMYKTPLCKIFPTIDHLASCQHQQRAVQKFRSQLKPSMDAEGEHEIVSTGFQGSKTEEQLRAIGEICANHGFLTGLTYFQDLGLLLINYSGLKEGHDTKKTRVEGLQRDFQASDPGVRVTSKSLISVEEWRRILGNDGCSQSK